MRVSAMATRLAATALALGVAVTGCGSNKSSGPSSTASSSASISSGSPSSAAPTSSSAAGQPSDYSNLLIKDTDIVVPGDSFSGPQTKAPGFDDPGKGPRSNHLRGRAERFGAGRHRNGCGAQAGRGHQVRIACLSEAGPTKFGIAQCSNWTRRQAGPRWSRR